MRITESRFIKRNIFFFKLNQQIIRFLYNTTRTNKYKVIFLCKLGVYFSYLFINVSIALEMSITNQHIHRASKHVFLIQKYAFISFCDDLWFLKIWRSSTRPNMPGEWMKENKMELYYLSIVFEQDKEQLRRLLLLFR